MKDKLELAKNWLLHSGIQNLDSNSLEVKGGFNSWYDIDNENYFYTYSEITGYAITKLLYLYSLEKNNLYLLRATLAAEWLLDKASHKSGGIKTRYFFNKENAQELYDFSSGIIHSFDNGIALNGLMDLYNVTKEERYLTASKMIGDMLIHTMQKPDGGLYASYSHKEETFKDSEEKWSTQSGSFHVKVCMGLLKLYEITKESKYKQTAIKLCDYALKLQEKDGRFISFIKEKDTHIHPHCYSAEGLLFAGLHLNNKSYLKIAANAVKWVLDHQMGDGGIPSMYVNGRSVNHERSDVLAQTLRLGVIMLNLELLDKKYEEKLDKLASRLLTFQSTSDNLRSNGGFFYGHDVDYRNNLKADKKNHVNSWCTMFALQALTFYKQYKEGNFKFDKNLLV
ncbi:MAG: glycoside hydrolase family 88 protein [Nanoarchaeota archaeon]